VPASKLGLALRLPAHFAGLTAKRAFAPAPSQRPVEKLLILGYGATGDLIFLLPALRAIRRDFSKAKITFLVNRHPGTTELLPATGLVDEIWHYEHADFAKASGRREISRRVGEAGFDALLATGATPMRAFAGAALQVPLRVGQCRPLKAPHAGWSPLRLATGTGTVGALAAAGTAAASA